MSWKRHIGMEITARAFVTLGWHDGTQWRRCAWEDDWPSVVRYGALIGHDIREQGPISQPTRGARILCCESEAEAIDIAPLVKGTPVMGRFWERGLELEPQ